MPMTANPPMTMPSQRLRFAFMASAVAVVLVCCSWVPFSMLCSVTCPVIAVTASQLLGRCPIPDSRFPIPAAQRLHQADREAQPPRPQVGVEALLREELRLGRQHLEVVADALAE